MKSNQNLSTLYCRRGHQRTAITRIGASGCRLCDKITRHLRYQVTEQRAKLIASARKYDMKKKYGLSLDEYNIRFAMQDGKCKICFRPQSELSRRLDVDHDHKTGKVRGLLCTQCNKLLGYLESYSASALLQAKEYLYEASL